MTSGSRILVDRVAHLDAARPTLPDDDPLLSDLRHFIRTVTPVTRPPDTHRDTLPVVSPDEADSIVDGSALLERLRAAWPEVVLGPVGLDRQYWISAERPVDQPRRHPELDARFFDAPGAVPAPAPATKPFGLGLFTSTGSAATFGMWWLYLQDYRGSTLFREPWTPWRVALADSSVLEVRSAADWAALVAAHPLEHAGMAFPDWARIAERWDGVHMTVPAVAATQGVGLEVGGAATAPTNWDVESTLWLRWRVTAAAPVA